MGWEEVMKEWKVGTKRTVSVGVIRDDAVFSEHEQGSGDGRAKMVKREIDRGEQMAG